MILTIKTKQGDFFLDDDKNGGIIVQVPYIDYDEYNNEYPNHFKVNIEKGKKADVISQFFFEHATTIVRSGRAYNLPSILFDECELPKYVKPDIIRW